MVLRILRYIITHILKYFIYAGTTGPVEAKKKKNDRFLYSPIW